MSHSTSARFLIKHWQLIAMQDGYTLHSTEIDVEPVDGGYLPAFIGRRGMRVIVELSAPLPTAQAARNRLRDVLWLAHVDGRISLMPHPLEDSQEQAA